MADTYFDLFLGYSFIWLVLFLLLLRLTLFQKKLGKKIAVLEDRTIQTAKSKSS